MSTLILLRSEKPSTYQRRADARPAASSRGGCSKMRDRANLFADLLDEAAFSDTAVAPARIELVGLRLECGNIHAQGRQ